MAEDVDNDYYYDEGTVNEQMDEYAVYEKDGQVHVHYKPDDNVIKVDDLAHVFGGQRGEFTEAELAEGEVALYISNGDGAGAAGDLVMATGGSSTDEGTNVTESVVNAA